MKKVEAIVKPFKLDEVKDALAEVIAPVDGADLIERMGYKYPPGAVRRLDDALLATFGTRYLDLEGNAHRRASLEARLGRLAAG